MSCKVSEDEEGRNPQRGKGMAVCLEVRIRSSTSVHVNSEPLAALSGMAAVALPWVSQRVPHQPFSLWMPWAMSWDDKKPKRKRSGLIPLGRIRLSPAVHVRSVLELHCPRYCSLPQTYMASFVLPPSLFPLDSRKYMLVSIYYVDYGKIS